MSTLTPLTCPYCDKTFHFKDLYENHRPACEWFFQSKRERIHAMEAVETLPSQQELFRLVQHVTATCRRLEDEVARLKNLVGTRLRRTVQTRLKLLPAPPLLFSAWLKSLTPTLPHLEKVFDPFHDLVDGMKLCLQERIDQDGVSNVPIRSFPEKEGSLYVYDDDHRWRAAHPDDWQRMLDALSHAFIRAFCQWEDQRRQQRTALTTPTTAEKDQHVTYLLKISGPKAIKERRKAELKTWMGNQVIEPIRGP